jgi:hypothetical protein
MPAPSDCLAARVRLLIPGSRPCVAVVAPGRRGACRTARSLASSGPAARHEVAERWIPPPFNSTSRRYRGTWIPGRACPASLPTGDGAGLPPGGTLNSTAPRSRDDKRETRRRPATVARSLPRPRSNLQHHPDGLRLPSVAPDRQLCLRHWPSGVRAGTPDRRGKRGEVAAIFAMITTNPTRSIGELGLGTTSSIRPPSCRQAAAACSSSAAAGRPRGTSNTPPIRRSGRPSSATTGRRPSALAVATSKASRPAPWPYSSRRAWTTVTLSRWSLAAVAVTQSSRRRWASTKVKKVSRNW